MTNETDATLNNTKGGAMIIDYDRFTPDETRASLLLAKELLRNMIQRAETDEAAKMYTHAYTSLCDAIAAFDRETEAGGAGRAGE